MAAAILLILIISLVGLPHHAPRRQRTSFLVCLMVGVATCLVDIVCLSLYHHEARRSLFAFFSTVDTLMISVFGFSKAVFIGEFVGLQKGINRVLRVIIISVYCVLIGINLIPPLAGLIYVIPEGPAELKTGPAFRLYFGLMRFASFAVLLVIIFNHKKTSMKYTVLLLALQFAPLVCFVLFKSEAPPLLLSFSLFMLVSYIIVYQGDFYRLLEHEKQLAEAKSKLMLSQIQPHFLYNTLTTISFLCQEDPKKAEMLTNHFSDYLRSNVAFLTSEGCVPFTTELDTIRNYLYIEQCRFEERLQVRYDIGTTAFELPMLSVQPLVENAVKHGVCRREEGGTVWISVREEAEQICIQVLDDGVGFDPGRLQKDSETHVGLRNVRQRLAQYGAELKIESRIGAGTSATVLLPREEAL